MNDETPTLADMTDEVYIAERDEIQHHFIWAIAEIGDENLVFKGGTLVRVCIKCGYRRSEDLDFDYYGDLDAFWKTLSTATNLVRERTGHNLEINQQQGQFNVAHLTWGGKPKRVMRIDANLESDGALPTQHWPVLRNHDTLPEGQPPQLRGLTLESLAVTKLVCLGHRSKARDWYDYDQLLNMGIDEQRVWLMYVDELDRRRAVSTSYRDPINTRSSIQDKEAQLEQQWNEEHTFTLIDDSPPISAVYRRLEESIGALQRWWVDTQLTEQERQTRRGISRKPAHEEDRLDGA